MSSFIDTIVNWFPDGGKSVNVPGDIPSQATKAVSPEVQLLLSLFLGCFSIILFSFLRRSWPALYSSRSGLISSPPPDLGPSFFGWILPLFRIKEKEVLKMVGLDALMLLRFFKVSAILFGSCTVYGFFVLIALTWTAYVPKEDERFNPNMSWSIQALKKGDPRLIAHCVGIYLFTFLTFYLLNREYQIYSHLRWSFLKASKLSTTARSTIIQGIPEKYRREEIIKGYFEKIGIGSVDRVHLGCNTSQISLMIRLRSAALRKVEKYVTKWLHNPCFSEQHEHEVIRDSILSGSVLDIPGKTRPTTHTGFLNMFGPKVDAIKYHFGLFQKYDNAIKRLRSSDQKLTASGTAFVTFKNIRSSHIASQIIPNSQPFTLRTDLAPEPRDLFWMNLYITAREQTFREIIVQTIMILVIFFWSVPISLVAPLLSLDELVKIFPFLKDLSSSEWLWALLSGSLPTIITISFVALTPYIFTFLSILQGEKSHSSIERLAISKHFIFLLINVLLVFTLASSIWRQLFNKVLNSPTEIPKILASTLPGAAPFFINYVMILGLGYFPFQLLQIGPLCYYLLRRVFTSTPRDFAELLAPVFTDYGWLYGQPMVVFAIVTTYSVVSPLILGVGTIYFTMGHLVTKYCLLYVYFRNYESGGLIWPLVFRRIVTGLFILQTTMAGYFALQEFYSLAIAMVPLLIITTTFVVYIPKAYPEGCKYLPADYICAEAESRQPLLNSQTSFNTNSEISVQEVSEAFLPSTSGRNILLPSDNTVVNEGGTSICQHPSSLGHAEWVDDQQYYAEPNTSTDYQQSSMFKFDGVLDASITTYGNPAILGDLPQLWLPQFISKERYQSLRRRRTCFCCFPFSMETTDYPSNDFPISIVCEEPNTQRESVSLINSNLHSPH